MASSKKSKNKVFSSGPSVSKIVETKTLKKGLTLCEDWDLSIDLKLPSQSTSKWGNIFGLQVEGTRVNPWVTYLGDPKPGSRVPAVFTQKSAAHVKLHVSYTPLGTESNHIYVIPNRFDTGNWINLKISQNNKLYEIKVDDKVVYKTTNSNPKSWSNVNVVMGNTYLTTLYYSPAIGEYRNFEVYSCTTTKTTTSILTTSAVISKRLKLLTK